MTNFPPSALSGNNRIGFHYFPDHNHYRQIDLETWLPRIKALGASWLVLRSPVDRSIPAPFLEQLIQEGIQPIIQFNFSAPTAPSPLALSPMLIEYARFGVRAVVLFDRPNSQRAWSSPDWAQTGLVDRLLDKFVPLANMAIGSGLLPIFPTLVPGGDYWDTALLQAALESLVRRSETDLLANLILSARAWTFNHPLDWGIGGPARWPKASPYNINGSAQNQLGFRIFDWYQAAAQKVLGRKLPIILFEAGHPQDPLASFSSSSDPSFHSAYLAIGRLLLRQKPVDPVGQSLAIPPLSDEVISANFWLLAADSFSPHFSQAWFHQDGAHPSGVDEWINWITAVRRDEEASVLNQPSIGKVRIVHPPSGPTPRLIAHYLLLPIYDWGISDWHMRVVQPFVKKYHPTIGFSIQEAALAARVTVVGNEETFPETIIEQLKINGAQVERISGSGTSIASQLQER